MKRGGHLRRRTPLQPGQKGRRKTPRPARSTLTPAPLPRTPVKPRKPQTAKHPVEWQQLRMDVMFRASGACQARVPGVCAGRGGHAHHLLPRSAGGRDELGNLAWLCSACHEWTHSHPFVAYKLGLLRRRESTSWPWTPDDHRPAWRLTDG